MSKIWLYLKLGGLTMIPIIGLMFLGFYLFFLQFARLNKETKTLKKSQRVLWLISQKKLDEAKLESAGLNGEIGKMYEIGNASLGLSKELKDSQFKQHYLQAQNTLNKHISMLQVIGGILPLLGLIGTVSGIITVFKVVGETGGGDPQALSLGISEALIATQTGLIGTVPMIFGYFILANKLDVINNELKRIAVAYMSVD